jgi:hypothetical protein
MEVLSPQISETYRQYLLRPMTLQYFGLGGLILRDSCDVEIRVSESSLKLGSGWLDRGLDVLSGYLLFSNRFRLPIYSQMYKTYLT